MDTDSLFKRRVQLLYKQPNTVRGRCIVWYAQTEKSPCRRVLLVLFLTLLVMCHTVWFIMMLKHYRVSQKPIKTLLKGSNKSIYFVTLPVLLLLSYGIVLPPIVLAVVVKDVKVKNEGYSIWHLDSMGLLFQRFIAALLILICLLIFESCADMPENLG